MSDGTAIDDPAALGKAGSGADEVAGETQTSGSHPVDETRSAGKDFGNGNWDGGLGGALNNLAETWASQASALVATCRALSSQCGGSGLLYQRTEAANTQTMTSLSNQPSPFG